MQALISQHNVSFRPHHLSDLLAEEFLRLPHLHIQRPALQIEYILSRHVIKSGQFRPKIMLGYPIQHSHIVHVSRRGLSVECRAILSNTVFNSLLLRRTRQVIPARSQ